MDSGKCGKNLTWQFDNGTLTISGTGYMENRPSWRSHLEAIKKVIINNGVKTISKSAFNTCTSLTSVTIPDSVTSVYSFSFMNCTSLTSIIIPNSVTTISKEAFSGCKSLTSIIISNSVTNIGKKAFMNCKSLTSVTIPVGVKSICKEVFKGCSSLKEIHYPGHGFEKILTMGNDAKLVPYSVAPIPQSIIKPTPPSALVKTTSQPVNQLRWKVEGKTLTVGGVSEIKAYSYEETPWRDSLNDIQRIIIEDGVEEISARAFIECRRLELLTIPASVKTIGDMAFKFCYCGDWRANGGRNVYWTLEDGVLNLKKNPTVRGDADFSTGAVTWLAVEKNITGIKLEAGVVPKEKFFEWLGRRSNAMQIAFG